MFMNEFQKLVFDNNNAKVTPAIDCVFNGKYQTFVVLTVNGIRIHSAKDGRLLKFRFKDSDLNCMALNNGNRKIYTGDCQGRIAVLNAESALEIT